MKNKTAIADTMVSKKNKERLWIILLRVLTFNPDPEQREKMNLNYNWQTSS